MNFFVTRRRLALLAALGVGAATLPVTTTLAGPADAVGYRVVVQMSDDDATKWGLALNNLHNLQVDLAGSAVELELVAFGPGLAMLERGSPVGARVADALKAGVRIVACENTMRAHRLQPADMLPAIGYVPSGVAELVRRQQEGWAYLRP